MAHGSIWHCQTFTDSIALFPSSALSFPLLYYHHPPTHTLAHTHTHTMWQTRPLTIYTNASVPSEQLHPSCSPHLRFPFVFISQLSQNTTHTHAGKYLHTNLCTRACRHLCIKTHICTHLLSPFLTFFCETILTDAKPPKEECRGNKQVLRHLRKKNKYWNLSAKRDTNLLDLRKELEGRDGGNDMKGCEGEKGGS